MPLRFQWDRRKARANFRKHRVSFDEAATVFADPLARVFFDEDHSPQESREILVGTSLVGRLLVVSFTERGEDYIRIISARVATANERRRHEEGPEF
jgi:uncharacterized DUF497 family protein